MIAMLETLVTLSLLVVGMCLGGALLAVVPFVLGVDLAERRGFSTQRWGLVCLLGTTLMLVSAYLVFTHDATKVLLLPAAALGWLGPAVVSLLDSRQGLLGGVQGAHEH